MKKFFSYVGAFLIAVAGIWAVSQSKKHGKLAAGLEEQKVKALADGSAKAIKKANVLSGKIDDKLDKAKTTKAKAEGLAKTLESRNETSLANRVRTFNDSL